MKQSPFSQCSSEESSYPSLDLKDMILPGTPLIGSMPLILTCYGLIETASSILICHLADKQLCHSQPHTLQGAVWDQLPHHSAFSMGCPAPVGCLSVFPQSHCVNEANFSLARCVGSLECDCKSRSEHFLLMDRVVKLHCCL